MTELFILGTRGIPADHGGYETFIKRLAPYLHSIGWRVTVYCQAEGTGDIWEDDWQGIHRVHIPVKGSGAISTVLFDWHSITHMCALKPNAAIALTLGYNTAVFGLRLKRQGIPCVINMDGLEWKRDKWHLPARIWLWLNERAGSAINDHLIADHPAIADHLAQHAHRRKISMIPYGADQVSRASVESLQSLNLAPGKFMVLIARPEPENSIMEIVSAFSHKPRGIQLVVLGDYDQDIAFRTQVKQSASDEVLFPGPIYDPAIVEALRFHSLAYLHGHRVGGTNPSLVESMAAGCLVIAHDNPFNRWVAGERALYFKDQSDCETRIQDVIEMPKEELEARREAHRERHRQHFTYEKVLSQYADLLLRLAHTTPAPF